GRAAQPRGPAVLAAACEVLIEELSVPADRDPLLPVDFRRGRPDAVARVPSLGGCGRRLAELPLLDLPGEDLDLAFDLAKALRIRAGRGLRRRELGPRLG